MPPPLLLAASVLLLLLGLLRLLRERRGLLERGQFAHDFLARFVAFAESSGRDNASYIWVMQHVERMQRDLGHIGLVGYQPPFREYMHLNYPIVLNTASEMRSGIAHPRDIQACQDAILRYIGTLQEAADDLASRLRNPLAVGQEGLICVLTIPSTFSRRSVSSRS